MSSPTSAKPVPPREPLPHECCGTGCIPCVMDLYQEDLEQYRQEMAAWESAQVLTRDTAGQT